MCGVKSTRSPTALSSTATVGRFWVVVGRKNLPRSKVLEVEITREVFHKVRRMARRWFASKGMRRRGGGALTLYTAAHWQWVRVLELAETGATVARDWLASPPTQSGSCFRVT